MARPPRIQQRVHANGYLVDFLAPTEELLTVAIDDTANTIFIAGIARSFCHTLTFPIQVFYIHEIVKVTADNPMVILMNPQVVCCQKAFASGFYQKRIFPR